MPNASFTFDENVLRMLSLSLRDRYVGKTMSISEIYILHGNGPPTLTVKALMADGTEFRTDTAFFKP